ncbi:alpha/beta hydrolase [Legionella waltersii]|uniref:Putative hydrolase n=1 Tax=Legionella waltersii TaxID=66969 RepID=A0A0W1AD31_9GAMM|nr:alpha/beta hydrolase [Legionella waltersii]KTD79269.1 putative hydrolase [Legionella waltersii]SNV12802.1 putative hydrolase [Legionella waltersii]
MINNSLIYFRDLLHAQFCYQMFITPIHFPIDKKYREFAKMACDYIESRRDEVIHQESPRHYVLHRFIPSQQENTKKVLITHGWMSRAAYMVRLIRHLHHQGYDVYALDFPAHGEARGVQLPWADAITIIKDIINQHGPFHGLIGHSFGGSMILNTLNLAGQLPEWQLNSKPHKAVLIASPTQMRTPVSKIARKFKLSGHGYLQLRQLIKQQAPLDTNLIRLRHFTEQSPDTQFLCVHGELDCTIPPKESINFCNHYQNSNLFLLPDADHVTVLMDERVENKVYDFLEN